MDKKDESILELLKENCRLTTKEMAKKLNSPITTIHNRIKKLENQGIIKGYHAILDNKKIGKPIAAYILATVDYGFLKQTKLSQEQLADKLKSKSEVEEAATVTGGTDILIKVRVSTIEELNEFVTIQLRNIKGIDKTQTMVILSEA